MAKEQLKIRALLETMRRTRSGIVVYPSLWIVISMLKGLHHTHSAFWATNVALFLLTAAIRLGLSWTLPGMLPHHYDKAHRWFVALALANPVHWGVLTALTIVSPESYGSLNAPMMLAGCGIIAAGTMAYAIDPTLRFAFTALVMIPIGAGLLVAPTDDNIVLGTLAVVFSIYVVISSLNLGRDYWESLRVELLLEEKARELEELSYTDGLTTLRNRRFFDTNFAIEWKRSQRGHTPLAVLMIDIDHFKSINDTHGHDVGDFCLREVGKVIAGQMSRSGDIAARFGGEEFVVLLGNTDLVGASTVAQRMLNAIRQISIPVGNTELQLRCSIGGCARVPGNDDPSTLLKDADTLLYRAKKGGRDRAIVGFDGNSPAEVG